jgi:hypothetical protein
MIIKIDMHMKTIKKKIMQCWTKRMPDGIRKRMLPSYVKTK